MASKSKDTVTADGVKFKAMLAELASKEVRIGFQNGDAQSDDGTDMCDIAMWNELGTINMPSRPFLRMSVDDNEGKIGSFIDSQKTNLSKGASGEQILKEIGIFQKDLIQDKIASGAFTPNAESTIRKKGSSTPLIDSGRMRQSVNYVIQAKGSGD